MKTKIFLLFAFSLLLSCTDTVRVTVGIEPDFKVTKHGVFQLTSVVSDFDHVYDSIDFIATNNTTSKQIILKGSNPSFDFAASAGTYGLYMGTKTSRRLERYAHFSANNQSVAISPTNKNITLPADTQQGLILIVKSGVQTVPMITCGNMTRQMWSNDKYYWAYVYDDGKGAKISTTVGGVLFDNIVIGVSKGVVYVFNPLGANVKVTDPFSTLQQI